MGTAFSQTICSFMKGVLRALMTCIEGGLIFVVFNFFLVSLGKEEVGENRAVKMPIRYLRTQRSELHVVVTAVIETDGYPHIVV
ncbi:MAG: hypothetical protein ABEJ65_00490 [bacterium]